MTEEAFRAIYNRVGILVHANPATGDTVVDGLLSWEPVSWTENFRKAFPGLLQTR